MKTASIVFDRTQSAPLYCRYPTQIQSQPAYVSLNLETGEIDADYSGEIGNAVPANVWHGLVRRYPINPQLTGAQVGELLDRLLPTLQRVLDGSSIEWDGNNYVGRLDENAEAAENELAMAGDELGREYETDLLVDLAEWLAAGNKSEWMPNSDAAGFLVLLEADLKARYTVIEDVADVVCDMWANELYSGAELPQSVAQYLLDDGRCADSRWTEELAAYAAGRKPE